MSLLFNPLYPRDVEYVVSQSIWELYEIHFWQVLFGMWGKNKAFLTLQNRYEKKHYEGTALVFLVLVFGLSYLIQYIMFLIQTVRRIGAPAEPQNAGVEHNENGPNLANGAVNERNINPGNQPPNPQNNE